MAILFNPQALNAFAKFNVGNNNAIANLGEGGNLVQKDALGFMRFRLPSTKERNNAVPTELLKALGQAFSIDGVTERDGKTRFSAQFMNRLEEILGPEVFKREDFGLEGGEVASGKPLTQRRITAIITAACAKSESGYDATAYSAKADAIADACGYVIPVHRHRTSDISAEKLIVFGYCQMLEEAKKLHEALPEDNTGLPYTAKMSGGNLYFSGADFWAVSAASSEVLNGYVLTGSDVPADLSLSGNGRGKTIFPLSAGADIRIMTNNVWKCDSNQPDWIALGENCSAEARSPGFADVYLAFKPDIINLQEMSPKMISLIRKSLSERGSSYSLITYYPSEQDDTPILYNRETLKFIDTGHHLFSYGNNSKTKGYTWCYFEHLPTGKKFVSLSTHLWWKSESAEPGSNEWRRRQAEEIVRLSDELIRKYDCPVFVQGDFNTQTTTAAYAEFMNGGFEDCHDIAATADNTRGHHSCGSTGYSRELYSGNYKSNAIDHMIVKNRGGARILTFRQPVTDFYWPLTDHIPVYIDVKF